MSKKHGDPLLIVSVSSRAKTLTDSWTKHQSELNAFNLEQGRMKRRSSNGALSTASHAPNDWVVLFQLPITADGLKMRPYIRLSKRLLVAVQQPSEIVYSREVASRCERQHVVVPGTIHPKILLRLVR